MSDLVQITKANLSTYCTAPNVIEWKTPDRQPYFDDDCLLFEYPDQGFEFGGLNTYDDRKDTLKFTFHNTTSTTRLETVRDGLRNMCLKFTPNDRYSEIHLDSFKEIPTKNPNWFEAEGLISGVINIVTF